MLRPTCRSCARLQASARNGAIAAAVGLSAAEVAALFSDGCAADGALHATGGGERGGLQLQQLAAVLQRVQDGATGVLCWPCRRIGLVALYGFLKSMMMATVPLCTTVQPQGPIFLQL